METEEQVKNIGTHDGCFHCDEVVACVFLTKFTKQFKNAKITRTRDEEVLAKMDIVVDVGGTYEPEKNIYDHHQRDFTGTYNATYKQKLSSAGLVYKHFGKEIVQNLINHIQQNSTEFVKELIPIYDDKAINLIIAKFYDGFVLSVDCVDNGINQYEKLPEGTEQNYHVTSALWNRVGKMNPKWTEQAEPDQRFKEAMVIAEEEIISQVKDIAFNWYPARVPVEAAFQIRFDTNFSGQILKLDRSVPWQQHLYKIEDEIKQSGLIKFVLFPDQNGGWRVQGVNKGGGFELRCGLKAEWRGIKDMEILKKTSEIDDIVFVHASGFIGGAKSYESAYKMAIESIKCIGLKI